MLDLPYPATPTVDVVDLLHGVPVPDPYRWLEDTEDPATRAWIEEQNALTESVLAAVPAREEIRERLTQLWDFPKHGVPFQRGGQWFQSRNSGLQNQPVLYVMSAAGDEGRVLLDPNTLSPDGTVALSAMSLTEDGSLLAYATSAGGSDWMTWRVRDVATGKDLPDVVEWSKFSDAAWVQEGFYYGALEAPEEGKEYLAESRVLRVFLHRLGSEEDELVFELPDEPELIPHADVTDDGAYLVVTVNRGTFPETRLHVQSLDSGEWFDVSATLQSRDLVIGNEGSDFLLLTDRGAERRRVVRASLSSPGEWVEVVPESEDALLDAWHVGGRLVCHYLHHAQSRLRVFTTTGEALGEIGLPPHSSVLDLRGRVDDDLLHLSTTSFVDPGTIRAHDLGAGTTSLVWQADVTLGDVVTEQVFVTSDDGTQVPVFLVRRRDVEPTGDVPVWLYGYGGFNIPMTPAFSVQRAVWVERGGLLAVANLRGGGEYGRAWYDAGRLANKQNVFDDFCSVAQWLGSTSGWSRPSRIAINGGSNGGLLVGACLTQRPELFGAAVPEVGVLDALRFHKFTIGWAWTSDFGDPDDAEAFAWLRAYSPLHNVEQREYPAVMVMTGDRDDRVVPGHSFKFAAALQAAQAGPAPVLIRVETSAGHGAGKPTSKLIAERTDFLALLEHALDV